MQYRPFGAELTGRKVVVTGANGGMGKETARELARMGAEVVLACRSAVRGEAAASEIRADHNAAAVHVLPVDLSSLPSVRSFAKTFLTRFQTLDVLVNNAAASLPVREVTAEGFERHWATNVLGPHLMTRLLLPALEASGHGRAVNVSTKAAVGLDLTDTQYAARRYSGIGAYRASKQAVRMLTWALSDQLAVSSVTANALNPGYVHSDLTTNVAGVLRVVVALTKFRAVSPLEGADTAIWLAASPDVEGVTGKFWSNRREARCRFRDPATMERLWRLVEHQSGVANIEISDGVGRWPVADA